MIFLALFIGFLIGVFMTVACLAILRMGREADAADRDVTASAPIQGSPRWKELSINEPSLTGSDLPSNLDLLIERNPARGA